ncbi:MAG TPA: PmoA family protein [Pirellulales bacterium]|nr:PmoA family protein [Pirellulales bacterium]
MHYRFPRCQVTPQPLDQVSFEIDGIERLRWHFGNSYPQPFFYPFVGPSGGSLTRMGHPGAPNHDHHRSIWFAHAKVLGIDFWSDATEARIRQKQWLCYQDGDDEASMAVALGWYDGHDPQELLEQQLVAAVRPDPEGESFLELQASFRPRAESLEFSRTNFGFLAVRVAKNLSAYFGGGEITNSAGEKGEPAIFGKPADWMDYSGPMLGQPAGGAVEGVTYFDHPANPGYPSHWHVREDGWMGAAACFERPLETFREQPLVLRYLLHAHRGPLDPQRTGQLAAEFGASPGFEVAKANVKHTEFAIRRKG